MLPDSSHLPTSYAPPQKHSLDSCLAYRYFPHTKMSLPVMKSLNKSGMEGKRREPFILEGCESALFQAKLLHFSLKRRHLLAQALLSTRGFYPWKEAPAMNAAGWISRGKAPVGPLPWALPVSSFPLRKRGNTPRNVAEKYQNLLEGLKYIVSPNIDYYCEPLKCMTQLCNSFKYICPQFWSKEAHNHGWMVWVWHFTKGGGCSGFLL